MEDNDPAQRIISLIREAALHTQPLQALSGLAGPLPPILVVVGNGNVFGGDTSLLAARQAQPASSRPSRQDPGTSRSITPDQAGELLRLVDDWVTACHAAGRRRFGVDMAWAQFNEAMGVHSYLHLHRGDFSAAVAWLDGQVAKVGRGGLLGRLRPGAPSQ